MEISIELIVSGLAAVFGTLVAGIGKLYGENKELSKSLLGLAKENSESYRLSTSALDKNTAAINQLTYMIQEKK